MTTPDLTDTGAARVAAPVGDPVLRVRGLQKYFPIQSTFMRRTIGLVRAVECVDLEVHAGETVGIVGESGCGKSTTGRTMLRLLDPTAGTIEIDGRDVTTLSRRAMVPVRRSATMIFQDPYSSLNPRHTIGKIISAPWEVQKITPEGGVRKAVQELMARVGLNPEHYNRFPAEFSGGQRQRIGIARALALRPKLVVCDEPVSALDVSIQAQVINLLEDIQDEFRLGYVFIAHDLSVVRHIADRIAVMYLGRIMEFADSDSLYRSPRHPYTKALLSAVPLPRPSMRGRRERIMLTGDLPSPANPPSGCVFRTRCWKAQERCATEIPPLAELSPGHSVACHFPEPERAPVSFTRDGAA